LVKEKLIISEQLVERLERSEINYMVDRMGAIANRVGNPEGVEIKAFGNCIALYSKTMPWGLFNNVKGSIEKDDVEELLQFYEDRGRAPELHIIPSHAHDAVLKKLHQAGFYQAGFHSTLYCEAKTVDHLNNNKDIVVRALREDEMELYAEIHCLGTGLSLDGKAAVAANNAVLYARDHWKYYIAFYAGRAAAVAVMHMQDNIASLTFATTLPQYRQLGLQQHLLIQRINDAFHYGCELVVAQCAYCSTSHRNMERAGMRIGYTRATWRKA